MVLASALLAACSTAEKPAARAGDPCDDDAQCASEVDELSCVYSAAGGCAAHGECQRYTTTGYCPEKDIVLACLCRDGPPRPVFAGCEKLGYTKNQLMPCPPGTFDDAGHDAGDASTDVSDASLAEADAGTDANAD